MFKILKLIQIMFCKKALFEKIKLPCERTELSLTVAPLHG